MVAPPSSHYSRQTSTSSSNNTERILWIIIIALPLTACAIGLAIKASMSNRQSPFKISKQPIALIGIITVVAIVAACVWIYSRRLNISKPTSASQPTSTSKPTSSDNINKKDWDGQTELGKAIKNRNSSRIKELISKGADVNLVFGSTFTERTPLQYAAEYGLYDIIKLLIDNGAEVDKVANPLGYGEKRDSPLKLAIRGKHTEVAELLHKNNASLRHPSRIFLADIIRLSSKRLADAAIGARIDLNAYGNDNISPLGAAAEIKDEELFTTLINSGADVHLPIKKFCLSSYPILIAVKNQWYKALQALVDHNADLDESEYSFSSSPLKTAFDIEDKTMAKILIKGGSTLDTFDYYPGTEIEKKLKEKGWDDLIKDIPSDHERRPKSPTSSRSSSSHEGPSNYSYTSGSSYSRPGYSGRYGSSRSSSHSDPERLYLSLAFKKVVNDFREAVTNDGKGPNDKYRSLKKRAFTANNPKELFGLMESYTLEDLKTSYRTIVLSVHSDKVPEAYQAEAIELFKLYQGTFELLKSKLNKN